MKTFYFKQQATVYYTVEAENEDEAFAKLEDIDPLTQEIYFEDAEIDLEELED